MENNNQYNIQQGKNYGSSNNFYQLSHNQNSQYSVVNTKLNLHSTSNNNNNNSINNNNQNSSENSTLQKLQNQIQQLQKSLEEEKQKNASLSKENTELKQEIFIKDQSLKKFEKEIIQLKQCEVKKSSRNSNSNNNQNNSKNQHPPLPPQSSKNNNKNEEILNNNSQTYENSNKTKLQLQKQVNHQNSSSISKQISTTINNNIIHNNNNYNSITSTRNNRKHQNFSSYQTSKKQEESQIMQNKNSQQQSIQQSQSQANFTTLNNNINNQRSGSVQQQQQQQDELKKNSLYQNNINHNNSLIANTSINLHSQQTQSSNRPSSLHNNNYQKSVQQQQPILNQQSKEQNNNTGRNLQGYHQKSQSFQLNNNQQKKPTNLPTYQIKSNNLQYNNSVNNFCQNNNNQDDEDDNSMENIEEDADEAPNLDRQNSSNFKIMQSGHLQENLNSIPSTPNTVQQKQSQNQVQNQNKSQNQNGFINLRDIEFSASTKSYVSQNFMPQTSQYQESIHNSNNKNFQRNSIFNGSDQKTQQQQQLPQYSNSKNNNQINDNNENSNNNKQNIKKTQTERHQSVNQYNSVNNKMKHFNQLNKKGSQIKFKQVQKLNQGASEEAYITVATLQTQQSESNYHLQNQFSTNNKQMHQFSNQNQSSFQQIAQNSKITPQQLQFNNDSKQNSAQKKSQLPSQQMQQLSQSYVHTKQQNSQKFKSETEQNQQESVIDHSDGEISGEIQQIKMPGKMKRNLEQDKSRNSSVNKIQNNTNNNHNNYQPLYNQQIKINSQISSVQVSNQQLDQQQSQQDKQEYQFGNSLFEQFMVVGPNKKELNKINLEYQDQSIINLSPEIQYKFPEQSGINNYVKEEILRNYAFPQGVETEEFCITDSMSQINEIIFQNNIAENNNNNCSVFVIKTDNNQKMASQQQQLQKKKKKLTEHQKLLEQCNSQKLLYGICFKIKDVMEKDQKQVQKYGQQEEDKTFWGTQKVYCFLTFYPFIKFFLDIIASMLNQMKMKRVDYYTQNLDKINSDKNEENILKQLEVEFFKNFMNKDCNSLLSQMLKLQLPQIDKEISFSHNSEKFFYKIPQKDLVKHVEAQWSTSLVLSNLEEEAFTLLYLGILCEKQIVFISQNAALLSSTLLVFHSLLKPFKWPHPMIFNIPDDFMHLLDSPVPILLGLNKSSEFLYDNELQYKHPHVVFVLLDEFQNKNYNQQQQQYQQNENNFRLDDVILNIDNLIQIKEGYNNTTFRLLFNRIKPYFEKLFSYETENIETTQNNPSNILTTSNSQKDPQQSQSRSRSFIQSAANNINSIFNGNVNQSSRHKYTKSLVNSKYTNISNSNTILNQNKIITSQYSNNNMVQLPNNSQHDINLQIQHIQRQKLILYPTDEQKIVASQIVQVVSKFVKIEFIQNLPSQPCYLDKENQMLDFVFITDQMVKSKGHGDSFMKDFVQTQLLTYYLEGHYEKLKNISHR